MSTDSRISCAILVAWSAVLFAFGGFLGWEIRDRHDAPAEVEVIRRDTVTVTDTVRFPDPYPVDRRVTEYMYIPVTDTLRVHDTTYVLLEREQLVYSDSLYRAWVSGYDPRLDSIDVYVPTKYITVTEREKAPRWSIAAQGGVGIGRGGLTPYVGIGVSYTLFPLQWGKKGQ